MAQTQGKGGGRVSKVAKQLDKLRNVAPARLHAAAVLTGNINSATAFGRFASGTLDIFGAAASVTTRVSENAYNNWLATGSKPIADVYPKAIGVYIGEGWPTTYPIKAVLAEHAFLNIQLPSGSSLVKQKLSTIPSGLAVETRYSTADTAGADKKLTETFGPTSPIGLFQVPKDVIFREDQQLRANLTIETAALAEIMALATALPSRGFIIEVVVYGDMALKISTTR